MACSSCSSSSMSSGGGSCCRWHRCAPLLLLLLTQLLLYKADAGIAGFSKWFSGTFQAAVLDVMPHQSDKFDHVCFDMNQVLHVSLHRAKSEEEAVSTVFFQVFALQI
jgi:XRN 5'-3' exonuclease N-terminus